MVRRTKSVVFRQFLLEHFVPGSKFSRRSAARRFRSTMGLTVSDGTVTSVLRQLQVSGDVEEIIRGGVGRGDPSIYLRRDRVARSANSEAETAQVVPTEEGAGRMARFLRLPKRFLSLPAAKFSILSAARRRGSTERRSSR
jgi:hypothetical protein